jgi:hypothetical protein
MSDSQTHEEANAADATWKQQLAAMDPEQLDEALKCREEAHLQNKRAMKVIDAKIARLEEQKAAAAAAAISKKAKVERSPSPSENNRFMQRDYASPDFMRCKYAPPNSNSDSY